MESAEASGRRCIGCQNRHPPPNPPPTPKALFRTPFFGLKWVPPLETGTRGKAPPSRVPRRCSPPPPPTPPPHPQPNPYCLGSSDLGAAESPCSRGCAGPGRGGSRSVKIKAQGVPPKGTAARHPAKNKLLLTPRLLFSSLDPSKPQPGKNPYTLIPLIPLFP